MRNKYYIESGSFRTTLLAPFAKLAVITSFQRFISLELSGRLSEMTMISKRGYSLDLFDITQTNYLTEKEVIQRQQNYIILFDINNWDSDPIEDIIFLPTKKVLNSLGYGKLYNDNFSINTDGLKVR
ncbi:MAG: hypothetical protein J7L15_08225 [Clostridiales bacterium]|nr:hypothetical protein [Clostridiales bacterium]